MSNHEEKQETMQVKLKRLMKNRWAVPAIYLGLAAVVLTTFMWISSTGTDVADDERESEFDINNPNLDTPLDDGDEDAIPVTATNEVFQYPVLDENEVAVVGTFFDRETPSEDQEQAFIEYNNYFYTNKGIDLSSEEGESFDVTAAMSGTVVKAEDDALFGQVVHIEHDEDIVTIYQSLEGTLVEVGQTVRQGDVIGRAGRNLYNSDAGVHLHFEIRKDGVPVNPIAYMEQPMSALPSMDPETIAETPEAEANPEEAQLMQ
ncbi:peptidoglycan DD-metalloendopeptidase family protein [Evansella sp. AB-rgal1]|uniref:peptidoglycan DD-metalloendopeptidase family protein n=1 Tax=Evansella sp. AB-rgal1 TaxID=3242696 RepID=UPI00359D660C